METKVCTLGALFAKSFSVDLDEVRRPSGSTGRRLVIRHPSAVAVVPILPDDETLVVTQYRYAIEQDTVELPAGKIDPGETPEQAAAREMEEETGYRVGRLEHLISFGPSIGYSNEVIHVFAAHDLTPADNGPDEDEISRVEAIPFSMLKQKILAGEIIDGVTILALAVWEWRR